MSDPTMHLDAGTERLLEESFERRSQRLNRRERLANRFFAGGFVLAAVALLELAPAERVFPSALAMAFVLAYAAVARVELWGGTANFAPTQIVFVPMLLLLPTPSVPLLVAAGLILARASLAIQEGKSLRRVPLAVSDAWFSLGPAAVLIALGAQTPELGHWPAYVAALGAQIVTDAVVILAWIWICQGTVPRAALHDMRAAYRIDCLLSPVGLLAALAAADAPFAALLVLPLVYLLLVFSREREARMRHSVELGRAYRGTALLLRDLLEDDDEYTGRHTEDVVELTVRVAEAMGLDEDTRRKAEMGALLHDIGKIHVPDEIINKPGPLDDAEWEIMKQHTVWGEKMLAQVGGLLADVGVIVRASHERWDGGGYPDGLAAEAIPVAASIVSACDAFNAMTTDRSYRKALPLEVAIGELEKNAGTQFAPDVVVALVALVSEPAPEPEWQLQIAPAEVPAPLPAPAPAPKP